MESEKNEEELRKKKQYNEEKLKKWNSRCEKS